MDEAKSGKKGYTNYDDDDGENSVEILIKQHAQQQKPQPPNKNEYGKEGQCEHEYRYGFAEEMNRIEFKDYDDDDDEFEEKQHFKKTKIQKDDKNNINAVWKRFGLRLKMKPNVYGFAVIDHIPGNSKKFTFKNAGGVCCIPDVDGQSYLLSVDLRKENMMKNNVGLELKKWESGSLREKQSATIVNKNCVLRMANSNSINIIRICPSPQHDKLLVINIKEARDMRNNTITQGYVNETLMDNLITINTKYYDHEGGFEDEERESIQELPGFGFYIKRKG